MWCKTKDKIFSLVCMGKVSRECDRKCNSVLVLKCLTANTFSSVPGLCVTLKVYEGSKYFVNKLFGKQVNLLVTETTPILFNCTELAEKNGYSFFSWLLFGIFIGSC